MSRAHGRITVVWTKDLGTTLTQDEAAGATVLHVDDVAAFNDDEVFDEDGNLGYLQVGDQVVGYTAVDDDASTITLAAALAADASQDDDVLVWDDLYGEVDTQQWAWVEPDGGDRQDPYEVEVDDSFELVDGDRGKRGESCTIRRLPGSDVWTLVHVSGRPSKARGRHWEDDDPHVITPAEVAAGVAVHTLKHGNVIEHSMQVTWGRVQPSTCYSVDPPNGVLTYTLDGKERVNDVLDCQYQYRPGLRSARTTTVLVDWQSSGWKHLQVATSDTTNRAGTGFDDSGWAVDSAAFARYLAASHPYGYPGAATGWDPNTKMWLRRSVAVPDGATAVTVKVRVDDQAAVYWNGTLVDTVTSVISGTTEHSVAVSSFDAGAENVLAVRGADTPAGDPMTAGNWTYIDVRVEAES